MSVLQNFRYLLYSHERDYQKPLSSEINFGLALTALVEVPNAYFLWSRLPHLDATLTLATHATILWALTKYNKTLVNWLLRAPTSAKQIFLKQAALTGLFITNFNTFDHWTKVRFPDVRFLKDVVLTDINFDRLNVSVETISL